jgi:hypothetical protein
MITMDRARRAVLALGLAGFAAAPAAQAADQRYAVLSLIGDKVSLVWWRQATGSNIDRNERGAIVFKDGALDKIALLAVDDALRHANPNTTPTLLAARDPKLYALQAQMLDQGANSSDLFNVVKGLLAQTQATRLILVSKHRGEARLPILDKFVGVGKLTGLGFYVDEEMTLTVTGTGVTNEGFVAPFAYLTVTLIDAQTMAPIKSVVARESFVVAKGESKTALRPWEAMSPQEKAAALERLINQAVEHSMPEVLAAE